MSLDVHERQVLIYFENDPVHWPHRLLMQQVDGSNWIGLTPDFDLETFDLASVPIRALASQTRCVGLFSGGPYATVGD